MTGLWLANLKNFVTGTLSGGKYGLDVNVLNTISTASSSYSYKEHRLHDASGTNINGSGGAFIQIETAANIANTITQMKIRNHTGSALVIAAGADAAAAAAATPLGVAHEGGEEDFGVTLAIGDKVWVRAMEASSISSGKLLAIFLG